MAECIDDFDCPGSQICFNHPSFTTETNFCDCDATLGWTGENCDELIPGYAIFMGLNLIVFAIGVVIFLLSLFRDLPNMCRKRHFGLVTFHWVILLLTLINYEAVVFTYSYNFFTPEGFQNGTTLSIDGEFLKFDARGAIAGYPAVLYIFFLFILYTSIALSWIQNAKKNELFTNVIDDRQVKTLKILITINIIAVVLLLFIVTFLGYVAYYLYIILVDGALFIMTIFIYGYKKFAALLAELTKATAQLSEMPDDQTSAGDKDIQKKRVDTASALYHLLRRTAILTILSFTVYLVGAVMIISFEYTPEKKEPVPNRLNLSLFGFEVQVLSSLVGMIVIYRYIRKTMQAGSADIYVNEKDYEMSATNTLGV